MVRSQYTTNNKYATVPPWSWAKTPTLLSPLGPTRDCLGYALRAVQNPLGALRHLGGYLGASEAFLELWGSLGGFLAVKERSRRRVLSHLGGYLGASEAILEL